MPIYEYSCGVCSEHFELLVLKGGPDPCPACGSTDLERLLSMPRVHSASRKERSLAAAKRRDKKLGSERVRAQREYELAHDD